MSVGLVYQLCCTTARPVHRSPGHQHRAAVADRARLVDEHGTRCWFTSRILPPNLRRSPKVAEVLRCCTRAGCRRGLPPGVDGLLSEEAAGLSATNIAWADGGMGGGVPAVSSAAWGAAITCTCGRTGCTSTLQHAAGGCEKAVHCLRVLRRSAIGYGTWWPPRRARPSTLYSFRSKRTSIRTSACW